MNKTLGIVFSNMHDTMMAQLTEKRTMGSLPFGGRYRLIDFVLSNMINSFLEAIHNIYFNIKNKIRQKKI